MSKGKARGKQSYANEELVLAMIPEVLRVNGFVNIRIVRVGAVKFADAEDASGQTLRFWLKQGWTGSRQMSAIQFGLFSGEAGQDLPDNRFETFVKERIERIKSAGASHALFVHMGGDGTLANWVALAIDDVDAAYKEQLRHWPVRARNTKSPTLWFEDNRMIGGAECVAVVLTRQVELSQLAAGDPLTKTSAVQPKFDGLSGPAVKKVTIEIERRMKQQAFRLSLGNHYGWRCVVSGATVMAVLDAAHLPGRSWRTDNSLTDGVLLRADLHRLLDANLARIENKRFLIDPVARLGEYAKFHDKPLDLL
ncbi:MAG: HNH endonuclease [Sulfuritalea sp.]|nr:HNH endonuclease [Sulfuritalea sp.]